MVRGEGWLSTSILLLDRLGVGDFFFRRAALSSAFVKVNFGSVFPLFGCCLFLRGCQLGLQKVGGSLGGVPFVSTLFFGDSLVVLLASRENLLGIMLSVVALI